MRSHWPKIGVFARYAAGMAVVALAASTVFAQGPVQTIRVICLTRPLAVVAADVHGWFASRGIAVELVQVTTSDALRAELAGGRADIGFAAVDNAVAMVEAGTDAVIVAGGEGSTNELIAQPGIRSVADLRRRIVIVDAPNTAFALQLKKILMSAGLQPARDYELRAVGSTPIRLRAMQMQKEYAATMLGLPYSLLAKRAGLVSLGTAQALIGPYQGQGIFVLKRWAAANRDLLVRYLSAYIQGQRWLLAPSNRPQVTSLLKTEGSLDDGLAEEAYTLMVGSSGYSADARLDVDAFGNVLRLRAEVEGQWSGTPPAPDRYYDLSYYTEAVSTAGR
jgi:ABC-type nitrate/sulfonate/bicarbonate transport system substrate-binding protein